MVYWWRWDDVIYALFHTDTSLSLCVYVCVCVYITSFFYIQFSLTLNGLSLVSSLPPFLALSPSSPLSPPPISPLSPVMWVPLYISVSHHVTRLALNLTVSQGSIFILLLFS